MRASLLVAVAGLALAQVPKPEKILVMRVFPQPCQIGLFLVAPDGSNEHPLVTPTDIDYDAVWSPDGASIVFTSERNGSADLYRLNPTEQAWNGLHLCDERPTGPKCSSSRTISGKKAHQPGSQQRERGRGECHRRGAG